MNREAIIKLALNKAFQLGQRYWSWADSEYSSHWKKADAAKVEFEQLVQDTINVALAEQPAPGSHLTDEQKAANGLAWLARLEALREEFAGLAEQPAQQEPVAWMFTDKEGTEFFEQHEDWEGRWTPLYTSPPASKPWVALTDEDVMAIAFNFDVSSLSLVAKAIETKLREKNT